MSIRIAGVDDRERWQAFVMNASSAHAYHQPGWGPVIERSFGQRMYSLISENARGEINGVLPLARLKSRLFGDFLVSLPYLNYGGPCAATSEIEEALIREATAVARSERVDYLELRLTAADGFGLQVKASKVSMRLGLPADADTLWKSLGSKLRNQINRPIKEGMVARIGGEEELESFHHVFSVNMRDVGTPVYGKRFFQNLMREFPESVRICTVYHHEQPAASGILVGFRGTLEIPWASALRSLNRLAPNMLLYWTALKHACEARFDTFDFGRSSPDAGTYRFKEQWGAKPVPLFWHYWLPDGMPLPQLNPGNPKYQLAINVWKHLPVGLTRLIGPAIVRNIP